MCNVLGVLGHILAFRNLMRPNDESFSVALVASAYSNEKHHRR